MKGHVHQQLGGSCLSCIEREQRLEKLEAVAQGALETLGPCDTGQAPCQGLVHPSSAEAVRCE